MRVWMRRDARYRRLIGVAMRWWWWWAGLRGRGSSRRREGITLAIGRRSRFGLVGFSPPSLAAVGIVATTLAVRDAAVCEEREARG